MEVSLWDSLARKVSVSAITGYQQHISPHKGFVCAHRVLYGGESCSGYIKRVIAQQGLKAGLIKSRMRFKSCKQANRILKSQSEELETPSTDENQQKKKSQPITPKSSCQDNFDIVDLGTNCVDASCSCPELLNMTPDCTALDCGANNCTVPDCGAFDCCSFDCSGIDCGGCGG